MDNLAQDKSISLDKVSALIFVWLAELVDDYQRGRRAALINSVMHVLQCSTWDACYHLGAADWDLESALRNRYAGDDPGNTLNRVDAQNFKRGWSSQHARLQSTTEKNCQICVSGFTTGSEPVVTRCCLQILCKTCVAVLSDDKAVFRCPFCRVSSQPHDNPNAPARNTPRRASVPREASAPRGQPPIPQPRIRSAVVEEDTDFMTQVTRMLRDVVRVMQMFAREEVAPSGNFRWMID